MTKPTITDFARLVEQFFPELKIDGVKDDIMEDHALPWKVWRLIRDQKRAVTISGDEDSLDIIGSKITVKVHNQDYNCQAKQFADAYKAMFGQEVDILEYESLKKQKKH